MVTRVPRFPREKRFGPSVTETPIGQAPEGQKPRGGEVDVARLAPWRLLCLSFLRFSFCLPG